MRGIATVTFERWFALLGMQLLLWLGKRAGVDEVTLQEIKHIRTSMSIDWPQGGDRGAN